MSVNSSSSASDSLLHPNLSSINSNLPSDMYCYFTRPSSFIYITFFITYIILLLPLCILILYLGNQQRCQQSSTNTATMMLHSDSITYHMVAMELIGLSGCIICLCGLCLAHVIILDVGICIFSLAWYGRMFFHILTCVERYLAVVHPITYLSLRRERGIRIRNISIGCVWVLCFGGISLWTLEIVTIVMNFFLLVFSLIIISFCSLSVLRVLIRPKPGEQGGDSKRVDQSKQRAFYTIVAILGVLLFTFVWNLILSIYYVLRGNSNCVMMTSEIWFNLPSSLVLPLLFLHRARTCCKKNIT